MSVHEGIPSERVSASTCWPDEEYHQDNYKKNTLRYHRT